MAVFDELAAVVGGDGLAPARGNPFEAAEGGGVELDGLPARQTGDQHVPALAFDTGGQAAPPAQHGVGFPVSDLLAGFDLPGTLLDADTIGDAAASRAGSVRSSAEFVALTQSLPQRSAGHAIGMDVLINARMTYAHPIVAGKVILDPSADLFGRPFLPELA